MGTIKQRAISCKKIELELENSRKCLITKMAYIPGFYRIKLFFTK